MMAKIKKWETGLLWREINLANGSNGVKCTTMRLVNTSYWTPDCPLWVQAAEAAEVLEDGHLVGRIGCTLGTLFRKGIQTLRT